VFDAETTFIDAWGRDVAATVGPALTGRDHGEGRGSTTRDSARACAGGAISPRRRKRTSDCAHEKDLQTQAFS
jgi:hypothetical protein